jgi:lysophospholipase L1-like esterase
MRKYLLLAAMGLAACGSDKTPTGNDKTGNEPPTTADENKDPTVPQVENPNDESAYTGPEIAKMGRMAAITGGTEMGWAGTRISARVAGTNSITIGLKTANPYNPTPVRFSVTIDGEVQPDAITLDSTNPPVTTTYTVSFKDTNTHTVAWTKITEGSFGDAIFTGLTPGAGGKLLKTATPSNRHIEFIGDSITNGYGVQGSMIGGTSSCNGNSLNSSSDLSFATLTAKALSADYTLIAYSGSGLVTTSAGETNHILPKMFQSTIPPASGAADVATSDWDYAAITADVVVVNLGTNDFAFAASGKTACTNTTCNPDAAAWSDAYKVFLQSIRTAYPKATIIAATGPMLTDLSPSGAQQLTTLKGYIQTALTSLADANMFAFDFAVQDTAQPTGCNYHPSASTHAAMASSLAEFIKTKAIWE